MTKRVFDNITFYIHEQGDGIVSRDLVFITKFEDNDLIWNRGYKPEKINTKFLKSLC